LVALGEILLNQKLGPNQRLVDLPKTDFHRLANASIALEFLKSNGVVLHGVDANDIVKGNGKFVLSLVWSLARHAHLQLLRPNLKVLSDQTQQSSPPTTTSTADKESPITGGPSAAVPLAPPLPPRANRGNEAQEEFQLTNLLTDFLSRSSRLVESSKDSTGSSSTVSFKNGAEALELFKNGQLLPQCVGYLSQLDRGHYPTELAEAHLAHVRYFVHSPRLRTSLTPTKPFLLGSCLPPLGMTLLCITLRQPLDYQRFSQAMVRFPE